MFPDLMRNDVFRLETRRLWLRWPRASDAQAVAKLAGDEDVAEMTASIPHPYPPGAAGEFILAARTGNLSGTSLTLILTPRQRPSEAIGCIGLRQTEPAQAELGYWLGRPFWGQGLMTEAAQELLRMAFQVCDLRQVTASTRVGNGRSAGVLEASGFRHVGSGPTTAPARGGCLQADHYCLAAGDLVGATGLGAPGLGASGLRERPLAVMQMQTA